MHDPLDVITVLGLVLGPLALLLAAVGALVHWAERLAIRRRAASYRKQPCLDQ